MVVRRTTYEDYQEDVQAAAAAAAAATSASSAGGAEETTATAAGMGDGKGFSGKVGKYGRLLLVAAVVGFKIVEWWTRVEAQVRRRGY